MIEETCLANGVKYWRDALGEWRCRRYDPATKTSCHLAFGHGHDGDAFTATLPRGVSSPWALIGPLTAEEWLEFRLRKEEDEDSELLRCCANTSAIRDDIFHLMRSYAEDSLLGAGPIIRIREAIEAHGQLLDPGHPAGRRLAELLDRMSEYYRREPA